MEFHILVVMHLQRRVSPIVSQRVHLVLEKSESRNVIEVSLKILGAQQANHNVRRL